MSTANAGNCAISSAERHRDDVYNGQNTGKRHDSSPFPSCILEVNSGMTVAGLRESDFACKTLETTESSTLFIRFIVVRPGFFHP